MIRLRRPVPADADAVGVVHSRAWRESYAGIVPDAYIAARTPEARAAVWRRAYAGATQGAAYVIAEDARGVCGFGMAGPQREADRPATCELWALYLLRRAQGRGAGKAMLRWLGRDMLTAGHVAMDLWVFERNHPARRFYAAMGGRAERLKYFGIGGKRLAERAYVWDDLARARFMEEAS